MTIKNNVPECIAAVEVATCEESRLLSILGLIGSDADMCWVSNVVDFWKVVFGRFIIIVQCLVKVSVEVYVQLLILKLPTRLEKQTRNQLWQLVRIG